MPRRRTPLFAFALLLVTAPAWAVPCAGFNDVDAADVFCPSVEWMKNRAVTTGCSAGAYCPADFVSRLGMAAFMQRLGRTLTPDLRYAEGSGATLDLDAGAVVCASPLSAATVYPRSASVRGVLSAKLTTGAGVAVVVVERVNGGAWTARNAHTASVEGANRWVNLAAGKGAIPVAVNTTTEYGLRVSRHDAGTADADAWSCQLEAVYDSRTGATSPF